MACSDRLKDVLLIGLRVLSKRA